MSDSRTAEIRRLGIFFSLAYFTQGISQDKAGMLDQVLKFYFTRHQGMTSTAYSDFLAPLILPWVIKPVYGLISDLFPPGALAAALVSVSGNLTRSQCVRLPAICSRQ